MSPKILRLAVAASFVWAQTYGAFAAPGDPIGNTLSVINVVTAAREQEKRSLKVGDDVRQSELIEVAPDASSELKLNDDTKLALGPGAQLVLDKFVYDPDKSAGTIGVDLVKGAFRFMTGVADKPSYTIRVPAASITVRGTIFDVFVQPDQTSWLLLHEGGVRVCNDRGSCRDHDEPGKLIRVTDKGDVGKPVRWAGLDGKDTVPFDQAFPFVVKPPSIDASPVFTADDIIKLGLIVPPKKTRQTDTNDNDKPTKKVTKKAEPEKVKPTKVVLTKPPKTKKPKRSKGDDDDAAITEAGTAAIIGIGIGMGGFGKKGGGKKHGGDHPKPSRGMGGE